MRTESHLHSTDELADGRHHVIPCPVPGHEGERDSPGLDVRYSPEAAGRRPIGRQWLLRCWGGVVGQQHRVSSLALRQLRAHEFKSLNIPEEVIPPLVLCALVAEGSRTLSVRKPLRLLSARSASSCLLCCSIRLRQEEKPRQLPGLHFRFSTVGALSSRWRRWPPRAAPRRRDHPSVGLHRAS